MIRYIFGRLASIALTFFVVSVIIFLMMHAVPGGPFDGNDMPVSDAVKAKLNASLGLDRPLYVQYFSYMWGVLQFDFGIPFQSPGETVLDLLARAWPPSLLLGGLGVLIGAPLGILLGMAAALNRNTWIDYLASAFATLGLTIPVFVTSMLLILVFVVWLNWLPASGWGKPNSWILPVNIVAQSLNLRPGDEILTTDHEYAAIDKTFAYVARRSGATVVSVNVPLPLTDARSFTDALLAGITPRTRVIFVSHITSATALVFPIEDILAKARARGIITIVDGAHAPGHIPLDLTALGADYYAGNCHKWLMAPKGSGFFVCPPRIAGLHQPADHKSGLDG